MLNTLLQQLLVTSALTDQDIAAAQSLSDILTDSAGNVNLYHFVDLFFGMLIDAGLQGRITRQETEPTDTDLIWLDNSDQPGVVRAYNGTDWVPATFADVWPTLSSIDRRNNNTRNVAPLFPAGSPQGFTMLAVLADGTIEVWENGSSPTLAQTIEPNALTPEQLAQIDKIMSLTPNVGADVAEDQIVYGNDGRQYIATADTVMPASFPAADFEEYSPPLTQAQSDRIDRVGLFAPDVGEEVVLGQVVLGNDGRQYMALALTTMPATFPNADFEEYEAGGGGAGASHPPATAIPTELIKVGPNQELSFSNVDVPELPQEDFLTHALTQIPAFRQDGTIGTIPAFEISRLAEGRANTYDQLRGRDATFGAVTVTVLGRDNSFDGAGGLFVTDLTTGHTAAEDNDGTHLVDAEGHLWVRQFTGRVHAIWFGFRGGVTQAIGNQNSIAMQAAHNTGMEVEYPEGVRAVFTNEVFIQSSSGMFSPGGRTNGCTLHPYTGGTNGIRWEGEQGPKVEGMRFEFSSEYAGGNAIANFVLRITSPLTSATGSGNGILRDCSFLGVNNPYRADHGSTWTIEHNLFQSNTGINIDYNNSINVDAGDSRIENNQCFRGAHDDVTHIVHRGSGGVYINKNKMLGGLYAYLNAFDGTTGPVSSTTILFLLNNSCERQNVAAFAFVAAANSTGTYGRINIANNQLNGNNDTNTPTSLMLFDNPNLGGTDNVVIQGNSINLDNSEGGVGINLVNGRGFLIYGNQITGGNGASRIGILAATSGNLEDIEVGHNQYRGLTDDIADNGNVITYQPLDTIEAPPYAPRVGSDIAFEQVVLGPDGKQWQKLTGNTAIVMPASFPAAGFAEYSPPGVVATPATFNGTEISYDTAYGTRVQMGRTTSTTSTSDTIALPLPFADANYNVQVTLLQQDGTIQEDPSRVGVDFWVENLTTTGFVIDRDTDINSSVFMWRAEGRAP